MVSEERDTRIPHRLGTDHYCEFEDRDEYVHMGDLVVVYRDAYGGGSAPDFGYLCGVEYDGAGFISGVALFSLDKSCRYDVTCDGVFYHATKMEEHDD